MSVARKLAAAAVSAGAALCLWGWQSLSSPDQGPFPERLKDKTFWNLVVASSEPDQPFQPQGKFRSDNLISNESSIQDVIPPLQGNRATGAYLGVGPEQNFTYIAALRPSIAFVIDIRKQNALLHLMYKALAETSPNRAEFLSKLFARPISEGSDENASAETLFDRVRRARASEILERQTGAGILETLTRAHGFSLGREDGEALLSIYRAFYRQGPDIRWDPDARAWAPTYQELMTKADLMGHRNSYLASEHNFQVFREYEKSNLIVPVTGDFAGDKALPSVGAYLRRHEVRVAWFYVSNVEPYLKSKLPTFASNVANLPLNDDATLIRTVFHQRGRDGRRPVYRTATLLEPIQDWLPEKLRRN